MRLAASVICADLLDLRRELRLLEEGGVDALHVDMMDGHLVPNMGIGYELLEAVLRFTRLPVEVHLAALRPEELVKDIARMPVTLVTVQVEGSDHPEEAIRRVRAYGRKVGLAIAPGTPWATVAPFLPAVDRLNVLRVAPGFAGQAPAPGAAGRMEEAAAWVRSVRPEVELEADGHVGEAEIVRARELGYSGVVLGTTALFRPGVEPAAQLARLRRLATVPAAPGADAPIAKGRDTRS